MSFFIILLLLFIIIPVICYFSMKINEGFSGDQSNLVVPPINNSIPIDYISASSSNDKYYNMSDMFYSKDKNFYGFIIESGTVNNNNTVLENYMLFIFNKTNKNSYILHSNTGKYYTGYNNESIITDLQIDKIQKNFNFVNNGETAKIVKNNDSYQITLVDSSYNNISDLFLYTNTYDPNNLGGGGGGGRDRGTNWGNTIGFKQAVPPINNNLPTKYISSNSSSSNIYYVSDIFSSLDKTFYGYIIKVSNTNINITTQIYVMFIFNNINKNVYILKSYDGMYYKQYTDTKLINTLKTDIITNNFNLVNKGETAKVFQNFKNGSLSYSIAFYRENGNLISELILNSGSYGGSYEWWKNGSSNNHNNYWGDNYDNYNHYTRKSIPTIFYGNTGETAKIVENNGNYVMIITDINGNVLKLKSSDNIISSLFSSPNKIININDITKKTNEKIVNKNMTYYGLNGEMATFINTNNGYVIKVVDSNGKTTFYNSSNTQTLNPDYINNISYGTVNGNFNKVADNKLGVHRNDILPENEDLYMLKTELVPPVYPAGAYGGARWGAQGGAPGAGSSPGGAPGAGGGGGGAQGAGSSPGGAYGGGGAQGAGSSPGGAYGGGSAQPSVASTSINGDNKCQPCAPCGRCPEPSFECKKVPNYNSKNNEFLPMPVVNSFSTFGM